MQAIYFPMTYISDRNLTLLRTNFQNTLVYQPCYDHVPKNLQALQNDDSIDIRIPVRKDEKRLGELLAQCKTWIGDHEGGGRGLLRLDLFNETENPDLDEQFSVQIKSAIKRASEKTEQEVKDPLFAARFFLLTAQEFDLQQAELGNSLQSISGVENQLFKDLKGEEEDLNSFRISSTARLTGAEDPGSRMTGQRISAWYRLFQKDESPLYTDAPCLFLTVSRAVFETVMENIPVDTPTLLVYHLPNELQNPFVRNEWQTNLSNHITHWIDNPSEKTSLNIPQTTDNCGTLQLVCLPGKLFSSLFSGETESAIPPVWDRFVLGLMDMV
jgi:hypothetical protein